MRREGIDSGFTPGPKIKYPQYFREPGHLYSVWINPVVCGELMRQLGMDDKKISTSTIRVAIETKGDPAVDADRHYNAAAEYDSRQHVLSYHPSNLWNRQQELWSKATLLRRGESPVVQIKTDNGVVSPSRRIIILDTLDGAWESAEKDVKIGLEPFIGKAESEQFLQKLIQEENPEGAKSMLAYGSRRALTESLAYGLYQLAHPLDNSAQQLMIKAAALLFAAAAVQAEALFLPDIDTHSFEFAVLATLSVLSAKYLTNEYLSKVVTKFRIGFREKRARKFARSISSDPAWGNLIIAENGWN